MCATDQSMNQSYGSCAKDQSNGNMLYVQRINPMGHDAEPDAWTEDQSYGTVHVAKCTYARSQVRALFQVQRISYMGTQNAQRVVVKRRGYVQH